MGLEIQNIISQRTELPSDLPYLETIIYKKVNKLALSCFEAIVHWFLTTFTCCYADYNRHYQAELAKAESQINFNSPRISIPTASEDLNPIVPSEESLSEETPVPPPIDDTALLLDRNSSFTDIPEGPSLSNELSTEIKAKAEKFALKLQKQYDVAQEQAKNETDKGFRFSDPSNAFLQVAFTQELNVSDYEVGVCSYIGRRRDMEDEHLITSFNLTIGRKEFPIQLFGVFDGHGGDEASIYLKENLKKKVRETLQEFCSEELADHEIGEALKETFKRLHKEFSEPRSGTTATVSLLINGKLWTANVGDSRAILDNGIQLSRDAKPTDPLDLKGIVKRGGKVFRNRINGVLAVGRAIGDYDIGNGINPNPTITSIPIPHGAYLIIACDGIFDVCSTRELAELIQLRRELKIRQPTPIEWAKRIAYSAYEQGSMDNLSVLVVKL